MKIITERLIIRSFNYSDDKDLYEMCGDYDTAITAGWKPHTHLSVSRNIIANYIYTNETFAIVSKKNNVFLGTISLYDNEMRTGGRHRELGFCLNKKYRGYGYMTEAVNEIIRYSFEKLRVDILTTCHEPNNIKSKHIIENTGFKYEGCLRMYRKLFDGSVVDCWYYSMIKKEYEENIK